MERGYEDTCVHGKTKVRNLYDILIVPVCAITTNFDWRVKRVRKGIKSDKIRIYNYRLPLQLLEQ